MDDDERTTGMGLWTDAREMFDAAALVIAAPQLEWSSPSFYLLGHGLEVAFKAYLRSRGHSLKALRAIGHDLNKAMEEAAAHGLGEYCSLLPPDRAATALLSPYYMAKHFEYRVAGTRRLPPPEGLLDLGIRLMAAIRPLCEANVGIVRGRATASATEADRTV